MFRKFCLKITMVESDSFLFNKSLLIKIMGKCFQCATRLTSKVACMVKVKLFLDWFYYNLIICKIAYKNLDKAQLFSRNQVSCLKIWKLWRAPTILQFNIFLLKLSTRFLLTNVCKSECGIFLIWFSSWVICKLKNTWFLHTYFLHFY